MRLKYNKKRNIFSVFFTEDRANIKATYTDEFVLYSMYSTSEGVVKRIMIFLNWEQDGDDVIILDNTLNKIKDK